MGQGRELGGVKEGLLVYTHSLILVIFKSNLIGSLSRTIQQYSPPSEWIMCQLGFFSHFFRELSFKSRQNPRLGRIQYGVFQFTVAEFCARWIVYNSRVFA